MEANRSFRFVVLLLCLCQPNRHQYESLRTTPRKHTSHSQNRNSIKLERRRFWFVQPCTDGGYESNHNPKNKPLSCSVQLPRQIHVTGRRTYESFVSMLGFESNESIQFMDSLSFPKTHTNGWHHMATGIRRGFLPKLRFVENEKGRRFCRPMNALQGKKLHNFLFRSPKGWHQNNYEIK